MAETVEFGILQRIVGQTWRLRLRTYPQHPKADWLRTPLPQPGIISARGLAGPEFAGWRPVQQPPPPVAEGVERYAWESRFGAILLEVRDGETCVDGQWVEPAGPPR